MAKCNRCGDPGAYVGHLNVECPNEKCIAFSLKQLHIVLDEAASKFDASWEINPSASIKTFHKPITVDEWDDEDTKPLYNFGQLDLDLDIKLKCDGTIPLVVRKSSTCFDSVKINYPIEIKDFIPKK